MNRKAIWEALGLLLVISLLAGCSEREYKRAIDSSFIKLKPYVVQPKYDGSRVRLFVSNRPSVRFTEVGIITITAKTHRRMLWFARRRAAREGCDAIIQLSSNRIAAGMDGMVIGGVVSTTTRYNVVGRFNCVIWNAAAGRR